MKIRFLIAIVLGVFATYSTIVVAQSISQTTAQPNNVKGSYTLRTQVQGQATNSQPAMIQGSVAQSPLPPIGKPATDPGLSYAPGVQQSNFFSAARDSIQPKVDKKLREYKKAKSSSEKTKRKDELKSLLETQFDERLKRPVSAIENSRKRLEELTEQHKSREKNSKEIVSLRLKVIVNEADGLGWRAGQLGNNFTTVNGLSYPVQWGQPNLGTNYLIPAPAGTQSSTNTQRRFLNQTPGIAPPQPPTSTFRSYGSHKTAILNTPSNHKNPKSQYSLLADYKESDEESEKEQILDELSKMLEKEFQAHQEQIQKLIDGIETQISDLEENIEMRKEAKDDIVALKLQTLINQANGLGF